MKKEISIKLLDVADENDIVAGKTHYLDISYKFELKFGEEVCEFNGVPFEEIELPAEIETAINSVTVIQEIIEDNFSRDDFYDVASKRFIIDRDYDIICGATGDESIEAAQQLYDDFFYGVPKIAYCDLQVINITGYFAVIDVINRRVNHTAKIKREVLRDLEKNIKKLDNIECSDLRYYMVWSKIISKYQV